MILIPLVACALMILFRERLDRWGLSATRWALKRVSSVIRLDWETTLRFMMKLCYPFSAIAYASILFASVKHQTTLPTWLWVAVIALSGIPWTWIGLPQLVSAAITNSVSASRLIEVEIKLSAYRRLNAFYVVLVSPAVFVAPVRMMDIAMPLMFAAVAITLYIASIDPSSCSCDVTLGEKLRARLVTALT